MLWDGGPEEIKMSYGRGGGWTSIVWQDYLKLKVEGGSSKIKCLGGTSPPLLF